MRLNDPLITFFNFKGKTYDINLAFDVVLDVFDVLDDDYLREGEKVETALELLLNGQDHEASVELWNYIYDNILSNTDGDEVEYDLLGNPMPQKPEKEDENRVFDVSQDADYIYASFMQAYGIDLHEEQGKMHWYKFKALLNGLPHNCALKEIIRIRTWKPSKHDSAEVRKEMRELQKEYALKEV